MNKFNQADIQMKLLTPRLMNLYAFVSIILIFLFMLYLQFGKGIVPCPLCILQRFALAALGITFLLGFFFYKKKILRIMINIAGIFFATIGALLAGRQVWLQHLPANQSADCGVSLQYMLQILPPDQVLKKIFTGTAECSIVEWTFLSLSIAQWTLLIFVCFGIFTLWQIFRKSA